MTRPMLYDSAGGEQAIRRLADAHHRRCLADPVLSHPFSHRTRPDHVERLASYWPQVLGAPPSFTQARGSQSAVLALHCGTDAEDDLGQRFLHCFLLAADDAALPDEPNFRAAPHAYMEWAVGQVMACSPAGPRLPEDLVLPRWSWDGLQPADLPG